MTRSPTPISMKVPATDYTHIMVDGAADWVLINDSDSQLRILKHKRSVDREYVPFDPSDTLDSTAFAQTDFWVYNPEATAKQIRLLIR